MRPRRLQLPVLLLALLGTGLAGVVTSPVHADTATDVINGLKKGLKAKLPEQRTKAVTDVGRYVGHLDDAQKKRAAALMNRAFFKEPDVEVRRSMVRALARLRHDNGWIPVIVAALDDKEAPVKQTARLEVFGGRADLLASLTSLIRQEKSASYKARLVMLLADRRKKDAVPLLIELMKDKKRIVQAAAVEGLEAITGEAYGFDQARWRLWHVRWTKMRPKSSGDAGPSTAPKAQEAKEPTPHASRSLHPEFYGLKLRAKDIVFVVDISGSVGSGGVKGAKERLVEAVELLGSDVNVAALFFSEKIEYWQQGRMMPATPENKENLVFFLRGLEPGKRTDVFTAFNAGLKILDKQVAKLKQAGVERKEAATLIAVSDGQDNMQKMPIHVIEERLDRLDLARTVVHSIVLGGKPSKIMKMLAYYGSGKYIPVGK